MNALTKFQRRKQDLKNAIDFLGMIGRPQKTTARDCYGHLRGIETAVTIYFQETDGAKNYHTCSEFDDAFAEAVKERWGELSKAALARLEKSAEEAREAAEAEYRSEFGKVLAV